MAVLITPTGEQTRQSPADGKQFTLAELQGFVGAYIEYVSPLLSSSVPTGHHLIVNEEGLLEGLAANPAASAIAGRPIVGPALLCTCEEAGCDEDEGEAQP